MGPELPHEFDGALDYDQLIEMLGRVEGEPVFVTTGWGGGAPISSRRAYTVGFVGTLRRRPSGQPDEAHFKVGAGEGLPCGANLILTRGRVSAARLQTFDGNDFFDFQVETDAGSITIASEASGP